MICMQYACLCVPVCTATQVHVEGRVSVDPALSIPTIVRKSFLLSWKLKKIWQMGLSMILSDFPDSNSPAIGL